MKVDEKMDGEEEDGDGAAAGREAAEALRKELDANLELMPELQQRLQGALSKLGRLMGELDVQRQRAPPGTIERAINAPAGSTRPARTASGGRRRGPDDDSCTSYSRRRLLDGFALSFVFIL